MHVNIQEKLSSTIRKMRNITSWDINTTHDNNSSASILNK